MPSPHTVVHGLPGVVQTKPASTVHVALQPSRLRVLPSSHRSAPRTRPSPPVVLPSSQPSLPTLRASPQIGVHGVFAAPQMKPSSIAHSEEHPSPFALLPSSHASAPTISPSPHTGEQPLPGEGQS